MATFEGRSVSGPMPSTDPTSRQLSSRLALTVAEAAEALGISERTLRDHLHDIPHVYFGRRIVVPVRDLRDWLSRQIEESNTRTDWWTTSSWGKCC